MDRPSSRSTTRRPQPPSSTTSTDTARRLPIVEFEFQPYHASHEPLVEDFQTRYMTTASDSRSPGLSSLPGIEPEYPAYPSFEGDEGEDSAPAPNLSRENASKPIQPSYQSLPQRPPVPHTFLAPSTTSTSESPRLANFRDSHDSSNGSMSDASTAPTEHTLPALQTKGPPDDLDRLEPVLEDDPASFDLIAAPPEDATGIYPLEKRSEQLMSKEHLRLMFQDPKLLLQFTGFLNSHRPRSVRTLVYYLDSLKALRAIEYANAISEALEPLRDLDFTKSPPSQTTNKSLHDRADQAFDVLVRDDLPAFIAYTWIQIVSESIQRRITGTLAPHLREASEGLAEVFCLSDPSRKDNPIVFASEEFQRTTQYGMGYSVGRNCRFLQGPGTNPHSVRRLAEACRAGKEHSEVFLNYRRDGSPFMNLLMIAPLLDSKGVIRYFIGAQVDVSGLVKDCTGLEAYQRLLERAQDPELAREEDRENQKDEFQNLSEMFNSKELEAVRRHGGRMHRDQIDDEDDRASVTSHRPRLLIQDPTSEALESRTKLMTPEQAMSTKEDIRLNGRLQGVYQHYLLIRPHPSLRILFSSPSLRVPGILQSPFLSRIGGSPRIRNELVQAFAEGRGVTAKIRWLTRPNDDGEGDGRSRWIHCTPLLGHTGAVGVWMVVLVDDETRPGDARRKFKPAPPVAAHITSNGEDRLRPGGYSVSGSSTSGRSPKMPNTSHPLRGNPTEQLAAKRAGMHIGSAYGDYSVQSHSRPGSEGSFGLRG